MWQEIDSWFGAPDAGYSRVNTADEQFCSVVLYRKQPSVIGQMDEYEKEKLEAVPNHR